MKPKPAGIFLFNMNNPATRDALRTARETNNGYILVSENIHLDRLEAVFNLDKDEWEFCFHPATEPRHEADQGLDLASDIFFTILHRSFIYRKIDI